MAVQSHHYHSPIILSRRSYDLVFYFPGHSLSSNFAHHQAEREESCWWYSERPRTQGPSKISSSFASYFICWGKSAQACLPSSHGFHLIMLNVGSSPPSAEWVRQSQVISAFPLSFYRLLVSHWTEWEVISKLEGEDERRRKEDSGK